MHRLSSVIGRISLFVIRRGNTVLIVGGAVAALIFTLTANNSAGQTLTPTPHPSFSTAPLFTHPVLVPRDMNCQALHVFARKYIEVIPDQAQSDDCVVSDGHGHKIYLRVVLGYQADPTDIFTSPIPNFIDR